MQNEIINTITIPDECGRIVTPGWARSELFRYERANMKACWYRKKEWDYYLFTNESFGVAFTISDLGYIGLLSASFIDLKEGTEHTESDLVVFPAGKKFGLGATVKDAHAECHTKRLDLVFKRVGDKQRKIICDFRNFDGDKSLTAELDVFGPDMDAMYIATPWKERETAFYYNCKMNCLAVSGTVVYGDRVLRMDRMNSLGVLDWGRGIWTYDNTWYWGTGSGMLGNEAFGFNLGYGFSDRSAATENCVFYQGRIHKLEDIDFGIPLDENGHEKYMDTWHITSSDGRFDAQFKPILDRSAFMDFKLIISDQHQVFGRMSGYTVLDDGTKLEFTDFICALEKVRNKY